MCRRRFKETHSVCAIPDKIFLCGLDDGHFKFEANYDAMNHKMRANKLGWKLTKKIDFL